MMLEGSWGCGTHTHKFWLSVMRCGENSQYFPFAHFESQSFQHSNMIYVVYKTQIRANVAQLNLRHAIVEKQWKSSQHVYNVNAISAQFSHFHHPINVCIMLCEYVCSCYSMFCVSNPMFGINSRRTSFHNVIPIFSFGVYKCLCKKNLFFI